MKKERYPDLNHKDKFSHSLKFSSAVVLLSTTLLSYNLTSTPTVIAEDQTDVKATQDTKASTTLKSRMEEAKKEIDRIKAMKESDKAQFKTDVNKAERVSDIDAILKDVKEKEAQLKEEKATSELAKDKEAQSSTTTQSEDKATSLSKDESNRPKAQPELTTTPSAENSAVTDRLEKAHNDLNQASQRAQMHDSDSSSQVANAQLNQEKANQNIDAFISDLEAISNKVDNGKLNDGETNTSGSGDSNAKQETHASEALSTLRNDIDRVTAARDTTQQDLDQYVQNKEANLQTLENRLNERNQISQDKAQQLQDEIEKTKSSLNQQDAIITEHLQSAADKRQAVKEIIGSTVDEQRAQELIDRIDTKGKTDKQIASQVLSQLDGISSFTSDSLLESMFDKANDKEALIQTLLSTKFEKNEAADIARQIMAKRPNSAEIVQLLKQHYGSDVSADEIIGNVIDQAHNKRQAIETMLATKFNDEKAHALANVIAKKEDVKGELLDALKTGLDKPLNDLLQADQDISRVKSDLNHIFDPLKDTPSLLGKSHGSLLNKDLLGHKPSLLGGPSLLDKLANKGSLLDGIPDIPNPSEGHALSLGNPHDDFLSGLFDDNGNFDLPATGEVVKKTALPIGIALIVIGGGITWFVKRRKSKQS
ncbi:hypothetical protein [Staphylococcus simulans]|uniref:hypothetical protein n=1 Tax=Staphylococcus simulans TaxID=1286 RepID=UPI00399A91B9